MNQKDVNNEKGLTDCEVKGLTNSTNIDPIPPRCPDGRPSQLRVAEAPPVDWQMKPSRRRLLGVHGNCDPLQSGQIVNDLDAPDRNHIFRYSRAIRGCHEAAMSLFKNVKVMDEDGKAHTVPIIWGSQEKAVAALLQDNVRTDNSLVVDRIKLPTMSLWGTVQGIDTSRFTYQQVQSYLTTLDPEGEGFGFTTQEKYERDTVFGVTRGLPVDIKYTLYVWTMYQEDMDQILEQVLLKFSPIAYLRVKGVYWEIILTLDGTANNLDLEPGDAKLRVMKYQFEMTAKTYLPQPITRYKLAEPLSFTKNMSDAQVQAVVRDLRSKLEKYDQESP